jgi:hypothetical protein
LEGWVNGNRADNVGGHEELEPKEDGLAEILAIPAVRLGKYASSEQLA